MNAEELKNYQLFREHEATILALIGAGALNLERGKVELSYSNGLLQEIRFMELVAYRRGHLSPTPPCVIVRED